jgi:predicted nucleotidyltransferase
MVTVIARQYLKVYNKSVLPTTVKETSMVSTPERTRLIAAVLAFVRAAQRLPGITRIALIGSLTTNKADPKDADLLVTVTDDTDLAPLASLSRKLRGHAQTMNRGGEVFLTDPRNTYLGRICPWKICAPGIRMSCDALHCGRRHYLHDDLKDITLAQSVLAAPAVELWPQVVARVPLPQDIEQSLLIPLKSEKP